MTEIGFHSGLNQPIKRLFGRCNFCFRKIVLSYFSIQRKGEQGKRQRRGLLQPLSSIGTPWSSRMDARLAITEFPLAFRSLGIQEKFRLWCGTILLVFLSKHTPKRLVIITEFRALPFSFASIDIVTGIEGASFFFFAIPNLSLFPQHLLNCSWCVV